MIMDMQNITFITLAFELHEQGISKSEIARRLGKNRETIILWLQGIDKHGLLPYLDLYQNAKKGKRLKAQVDPLIKRWVWDIRDREFDCCGQKIQYFLDKEHGIYLSTPTIYKVLKEKYVVKSKWKKNQKRGPVPKATKPREVIQMDSIDFGDIFAFTGVDIYTKEADILLTPELTSLEGERFLDQSMKRCFNGHTDLLQADGGPEFKDHFKAKVYTYCDRYRVSRPYKKNEQSYIESFNRTVRKECLGWQKYRLDQINQCQILVESFLSRYHYHRPHMGLNMQPPLQNTEG